MVEYDSAASDKEEGIEPNGIWQNGQNRKTGMRFRETDIEEKKTKYNLITR